MTRHVSRSHRVVLAAATAALAVAVAGCAAGTGTTSESVDAGGSTAVEGHVSAPDEAQDRSTEGGSTERGLTGGAQRGTDGTGAARPAVQTRAVIRTGEVVLVAREMNRARLEVDGLLGKHGGYLASEDTTNDRRGRPQRSVLVLRVPEPAFADVMAGLGGIGRTERTDRSSEDVTTEVIDVDTRVATAEASLARLQRFLRAARDVDDMIRLESEIATRQAALESLKAQQKYLADQTSLSTITVHLRTPAAPGPAAEDDAGFLSGLAGGWSALKDVLVGAATVTGAVLPFAVALAVVGVPVWLLVRAVRRRRPSAPLPPPAEPA